MNTTLITATEDSTGKTVASVALARLAQERGESVGYIKPKGTRLRSNVGKTLDPDPLLAQELLGLEEDVSDLEPVVYSPTLIEGVIRGSEDPGALRERVREAFDALSADRDRMFVDGGSTYEVGGIADLADADVADITDAEMLLLAGYDDARDVDTVLAAADALGERLGGVVFNAVPENARDEVQREVTGFLERRGVQVHGVLPRRRELAGVTVAHLADSLGAEVLTEAPTDGMVERLHVGAMSGESALRYYRRTSNAAVITGGDRADLHAAALEAPGVNCLVLSGGHEPDGAIVGKAEERGVPILLVQTDTLTAVERAEEVVQGGRALDAEAVDLMRDLLHDHADVDAVL